MAKKNRPIKVGGKLPPVASVGSEAGAVRPFLPGPLGPPVRDIPGSAGSYKDTLGEALSDAVGGLFGTAAPGYKNPPKAKQGAPRGPYKGTAGYRPAITAPNSKQVEQQNRADKKYGKGKYVAGTDGKLRPVRGGGSGSGGSGHSHAPGKPGKPSKGGSGSPGKLVKQPDEIADMLAGMLSQSERLTGFYNTQLKGISDQTVKDGLALATAQGSLGTMRPTVYYGGDEETAAQANKYTDLVNAAAQADTKARLASSQSSLAGTANAQQAYYNALRDNANMRHIEYARSLRAMEPKLRADRAAAEAETALKQAEQKYLYDKLGVDSQYKQGQLALDQARLNETVRNNNLLDSSRRANLQLSLADKNVKNALAGSRVSSAERKEINAWVRDHLYVKNTREILDDNGMPTGQSVTEYAPKALAGKGSEQLGGIIKQMIAAGFSPDSAVRVAQEHAKGNAMKMGGARFFHLLVSSGVPQRQAIAQISRVFGANVAKQVKRSRDDILSAPIKHM